VCIVVYLLLIYFIMPILDKIMTWIGIYFISERYGGGAEAVNPGLISLIASGLIQNSISAYCAIGVCKLAFQNANNRVIAIVFGIFIAFSTTIFTYVYFQNDGIIAIIFPIIMAPAWYFAFQLWNDEYST